MRNDLSMRGRMIGLILLALPLVTACSPQEVADDITRQAAESVILPVVGDVMPEAQAQGATTCILQNATIEETRILARDVGVEAGTSTVDNILVIAGRPGTLDCFRTIGAPILPDRVAL
jgi:hypothetical protein